MKLSKIFLTFLVPMFLSSCAPAMASTKNAPAPTAQNPHVNAPAYTATISPVRIYRMISATRSKLGLTMTRQSSSITMRKISHQAITKPSNVSRLHKKNLIVKFLHDEGYDPKSYSVTAIQLHKGDDILTILRKLLTNSSSKAILLSENDVEVAISVTYTTNVVGVMLMELNPKGLSI